jgi:NitT/TauT family transport system substrate-binding protein
LTAHIGLPAQQASHPEDAVLLMTRRCSAKACRRARPVRRLSAALALVAATLLGVQAPLAQAAGLTPMTIGAVIWIGYGPLYVADALGLWQKRGIKVTLRIFSDPALIPPALASGAVDGGVITYDQVIGQDARGGHTAVVMPIDYSDGGDAIVAATSIKDVSELKGQRVAFNALSPSDFLLAYALSTRKLSPKDIQPADMPPEDIPSALAGGRLKAGVTYEPFVSQITQYGGGKAFHVLYSSHDALGLIADVLAFEKNQRDKHPDEIRAVMQGYFDGLAYMNRNPGKSAEIIAKAMSIRPAEIAGQMKAIHNPTLAEMMGDLTRSSAPKSFANTGVTIGRILIAKGQIRQQPPFEDTVAPQFLNALVNDKSLSADVLGTPSR